MKALQHFQKEQNTRFVFDISGGDFCDECGYMGDACECEERFGQIPAGSSLDGGETPSETFL